jgi:phospho-N-acetylmuramoyl-pentapeptide-transferase
MRQGGRQGLYGWEKLVFQFGLGALVCWFCFNHGDSGKGLDMAHVLNVPFQKTYKNILGEPADGLIFLSRIGFVVLGMMMITGLSNAVNITDGLDGLASGVTSAVGLGLLVLGLIAGKDTWANYLLVPHVPGSGELAIIAGGMAGACLGFLWFNCSPADVFMGDTGALALGGLIGYIATVVRQEILVLFMCGVFLFEIISVIMQVGYFKATGKRIFKCAPVHHHLHQSGWQETRIVTRAWIVAVLLVVLSLALIKLR